LTQQFRGFSSPPRSIRRHSFPTRVSFSHVGGPCAACLSFYHRPNFSLTLTPTFLEYLLKILQQLFILSYRLLTFLPPLPLFWLFVIYPLRVVYRKETLMDSFPLALRDRGRPAILDLGLKFLLEVLLIPFSMEPVGTIFAPILEFFSECRMRIEDRS